MVKNLINAKKLLKIPFSTHYPKLDLPVFTTVRNPDNNYHPGKIYWIEIKGRLAFQALLLHCQMVSIKTFSKEFIKFDTNPDMTRKKFLEMLSYWYQKKDFWRGNKTRMQLLLLYKDFEKLKPRPRKKSKPIGLEALF